MASTSQTQSFTDLVGNGDRASEVSVFPGSADDRFPGFVLPARRQAMTEMRKASQGSVGPRGVGNATGSIVLDVFQPAEAPTQDPFAGAPMRRLAAKLLHSSSAEGVIALMILFNFMLICIDTDGRADLPDAAAAGTPAWVNRCMDLCFVTYMAEFFLRIWVEQMQYVHSVWNILDLIIIAIGCAEYIVAWSGARIAGVASVKVLRLFRLLRLLRVMRIFAILKELRRLVQMMGGCCRTLFWSFLLLILVMTIWACIAVEVINPVVQDNLDVLAWTGCESCGRAFASVFWANVTIFQTVVAGDNWGYMAIPVIEAEPWLALIFAGTLMTLVFGVMNLIVAVIVDTCAESRAKDFASKAVEMESEEEEEKRLLFEMFQKIDEDCNGTVSWDELDEASRHLPSFRQWLRVVDLDEDDLREVFLMLDEDGTGELAADGFVRAMYRLKNTDSRTTTKLIKHVVTRLEQEQHTLKKDIAFVRSNLESLGGRHTLLQSFAMEQKDTFMERRDSFRARLHEEEDRLLQGMRAAIAKATQAAIEVAADKVVMAAEIGIASAASNLSRRWLEGPPASVERDRGVTRSHGWQGGVPLPAGNETPHQTQPQRRRPTGAFPVASNTGSPRVGPHPGDRTRIRQKRSERSSDSDSGDSPCDSV